MDFINAALPVVFAIVGIALIWFVAELAITVRKARGTIDDLKKDLDPIITNANDLLDSVNGIVESVRPAIDKVDPLVGKVNLTVDAANLEIMRVDQILEDVTQITDSLSSATTAVDKVAQAPVSAVEGFSKRIRDAFRPRRASTVSQALGEQKESGEVQASPAPAVQQVEQVFASETVAKSDSVQTPGASTETAPAAAETDDVAAHAAHAAGTDN